MIMYLTYYQKRSSSFNNRLGELTNKLLKWNHSQEFLKALTNAQKLHYRRTILEECLPMNRNKNLLILYHLWKKLSKFSNAQKKVFHAFCFQHFTTANSKFSFCVSLCEFNCIKILTVSLVLNLSILAEILCVYLLWCHHLPATKKEVQASCSFAQMK